MLNGLVLAMIFSTATTAAPARPSEQPLVRLVGQHSTITICSTSSGARYSAIDARGTSICSDLTLNELRKNHPELSLQIDWGICASSD